MSSELIPVTQMEIKHLSHFFEDLPLSSVQKNLTRTIFNKTDNVYNQNEDVEDFFQHNICEKDQPEEAENQADDDSEAAEEEPKDDKIATFESSSLGFSTNSFYKKKNEKKINFPGRKEGKKKSLSKRKSPIQFDKFDYYHFSSSKKYFNYKYPKLHLNDSSSFLTGMSANLEKRREKILRNTKGLEDCLFNHRERKEREDEESLLPPSSSLPPQSSRYFSHSLFHSSIIPTKSLFPSVYPPLSSLPHSSLHPHSPSNLPFTSSSFSPPPSSLLSPTTSLLRSRFRKEFVDKALFVQKKFIVHADKKELISKNLKKLEILRETLKSTHTGKLWVSPFKTFRGRDEKAGDEEKVGRADGKRRKPIEDEKASNREERTKLYGVKGKKMNKFQKEEEINLNNEIDNLDRKEKQMNLSYLTKSGSFKMKERSPFLKGKALFSDKNQKTEIFNEYQNLIAASFQKANFPIKKGRVLIVALFELYPFLARMTDNEKNRMFQAFGFEMKEREIELTYENFIKFFKVLVKEEEGEECIVFWKKYFQRKKEDGERRGEKKESEERYVYKRDVEDIIWDFRSEGFANKKMDEMVKKIKFVEGKIKESEFEKWLRRNKYFTELMLCLMKRM